MQEIFYALCTNPMQNKFMAIKTYMSKSYAIVEWSYIKALMLRLFFLEKWVELLMFCVTLVFYEVVINGETRGKFIPTSGLRPGDLLSPFLFTLCPEALISLLSGLKQKITLWVYEFPGLVLGSHIFSLGQCMEILNILDSYGKTLGQRLNAGKSSIMFCNKVEQELKQGIKDIFRIMTEGCIGKYLGLPKNRLF